MAAKRSLTIVQMNDTHAYFDLHQELFWQGDHAVYREAGGYARIATIVKQIRAESQVSCLFCDYLKFIGAGCHDSSLGIYLWAKGI
jgi:2',3'-cyclic-nucleotide 2'-phosphodiesterase (5'-nucleotidase family)